MLSDSPSVEKNELYRFMQTWAPSSPVSSSDKFCRKNNLFNNANQMQYEIGEIMDFLE